MMMRRLLLCCLMAFSVVGVCAEDNYVRDSLLVRLEKMPHDEQRLQTLYDLVRVTQENTEECRQYNKQLFDEAELQNNNRFRCRYYFTEMVFAYNTYDNKKLQELANIVIPLARESKYYSIMFRAWRCKIDFLILTQDLERNEREAKQMLAEAQELEHKTGMLEAYLCLSNIYSATYRKADAIAILEQALPVARKSDKMNDLKSIWRPLLFLYAETDNYPKWLSLLNEAESRIGKLPADEIRMQNLFLLILYSSYTEYYTKTDDLGRAELCMRRAESFLNDASSPLYIIYFNKVCSMFYETSQQYQTALEWMNLAIAQLQRIAAGEDYYGVLTAKARLLNKMNRHQDAIRQFKAAIDFKDSVQVVTINKQYEQLKKDFNADQLLIEKTELQNRQQVYMLGLLAIGLIGIAVFVVYLMRSHRTLRKAESEMRAMNEKLELVNQTKNRFLSNISSTIREPLNIVVEGSLVLAERKITDPAEQQQLSGAIRQKAGSLLNMINDILDLSRLEAGMMKFDMVDAEVTSMLYDAASAVESPENKVTIHVEYPDNTLFMLHLDGNRLMQVFKNLFTPENSEVEVWAGEEQKRFRIRVSGSTLTRQHPDQEVVIRNEINRMLIVRFGGTYTVFSKEIHIELPVTERINPSQD